VHLLDLAPGDKGERGISYKPTIINKKVRIALLSACYPYMSLLHIKEYFIANYIKSRHINVILILVQLYGNNAT
jgi:hypothetical protein